MPLLNSRIPTSEPSVDSTLTHPQGETAAFGTRPRTGRASILDVILVPFKFKRFYDTYKNRAFNLLDIGFAYHCPSQTVKYFPLCNYYGVDRDIFENDEADLKAMSKFFKVDLEKDTLDAVPSDFFEVIIVSHVIEHLRNGLQVLTELTTKIRPGGLIYIEYPGLRSLATPSAKKGCLHFHDDPTHVRMYSMHEIVNTLLDRDLKIIRAGTRRDKVRLMLTPVLMLRGILQGDIWSGRLWDFFGFAEYVIASKPERPQVSAS